jgi:cytochrome c
MDSFELNKIIAAILMVALLVIGLGKIADVLFYVEKPKNPGYQVEIESQLVSVTSQADTEIEKIDIAAIMAQGDIQLIKVDQIKLVLHYTM